MRPLWPHYFAMSIRSREISRGEISLAVVAFAIVVGTSAGYALSAVPPEEKALVAAAAGEQTVVGKDCADTRKVAAARGGPDTGGTNTFKDETNFKDTCVAAVLKKNLPQRPNTRSAESYECVGKTVKVSIKFDGSITEAWQPKPGQMPGLCTVTACGPTGKNCVAVKGGLAGLDTNKLKEYVNPSSDAYQSAASDGLATRFDVTKDGTIDPRTLAPNDRSVLSDALFPQDYASIDAAVQQPIFEPLDGIQDIANTDFWQQQGQSILETNSAVTEYGQQWLNDYWQDQMQPYFSEVTLVHAAGESWLSDYSGSNGIQVLDNDTLTTSNLAEDAPRVASVSDGVTGFDGGGAPSGFPDSAVPQTPPVPAGQAFAGLGETVEQPAAVPQEFAQQSPVWKDPFAWQPPSTGEAAYNVLPDGQTAGGPSAIGGIADIAGGGAAGGASQGASGQTFASARYTSALESSTPRAVWEPQEPTAWGPVTRGLEGTPAPVGSVASGVSGAFDEGGVGIASAFPGEVVDITQPFGSRRIAYALNQNLLDAVTLNPAVESRSLPANSWAGTPVVADTVRSTYVAAAGSQRAAVAALPAQFTMTWSQSTFVTL